LKILGIITLAVLVVSCGSRQQQEARHLERGKRYLADQDYVSAIAEFKDAAQAMPSDAEPYYQQAMVHLAEGNFRLAVQSLRSAVEINPKHGQAQLKLAELMTTSSVSRDVKEAKSSIQEFLQSNPDDMEAIGALAAADWKLGLPEEAEGHLKKALEKFPQNVRASALLAKVRLLNKDLPGAEEIVKQAAEIAPQSTPVLMAAAEFCSLLGKAPEAGGYFRRVLSIDPNHAEALLDLAALEKTMRRSQEAEALYRRLGTLRDPKYRILHVVYLFDEGRAPEAIPELESLRRQDAGDRGIRSLLVNAYTAAGRNAEAESIVTAALLQNPKDGAAFFARSLTRLRSGRITEAQTDLSHVLALDPNSAQAHFLQAIIYQRGGALKAEQHELGETLRLKPDLLAARLELARVLVHNDAAQAAIELLDAAIGAQKKSPALIAQRNWALFLIGDAARTGKAIQEGLSIARTAELLVQDALFNLQQGKIDAAQKSADEALKQNPSGLQALNLWARILARRGDPIPVIRAYAREHANLPLVQQFYGELLASSGKRPEARAAFLQAKAAQPGFSFADFSLAQMAIQDGRPDEARRFLEPLLTGIAATRAHLMMAAVEQMQHNAREAIRHFETVVAAEPDNVSALNDLACLLLESGRSREEALKYAQRAQELAPHDPNVEDTLGWVLYHRGMYLMALNYLRDSVSRQNTALTNLHLAMTYAKIGDLRQGREFLEIAQRQSPGLAGLDVAKQMLGTIN
jgi:tetratricopeptide (TPR) repeat protein